MVRFTSGKDSFTVAFEDNKLYLDYGTMSLPVNSLSLVIDKSGIATFKRSSTNDVLFSGLIEECEFDGTTATKETIDELFAQTTCKPPVDEDTVVSSIELEDGGATLVLQNATGGTIAQVDTAVWLSDVTITGASLINGELILYPSEGDPIAVDLSEMMQDYYNQAETDAAIADAVAEEASIRQAAIQALETTHNEDIEHLLGRVETLESDKADKTSLDALEAHIDETDEVTARALNELQTNKASKTELQEAIDNIDLSSKQDVLTPGDNITIENNVISSNQVIELTQAEYDELVEQGTVDEAKIYIITDAPEINLNNYTLTSTTAALQTQVNANTAAIAGKQDTLTAGEGITIENGVISAEADLSDYYTKTEIDNAEQATSAALNDLNIRKLDASAYTPVDLSTYATKQELQDAIESIDLSEIEASIDAVEAQVDNNAEVTARALNELQTNKVDKSSLADYATKNELEENYIDWDDFDSEMVNYATTADTASLQTAINNKADASALAGYATTSTTDNLQTQLTALQTTVAGKAQIVHLTQAQYDALQTKDSNTLYVIDDAIEVNMANYYTKSEIDTIIGNINSILTQINGN